MDVDQLLPVAPPRHSALLIISYTLLKEAEHHAEFGQCIALSRHSPGQARDDALGRGGYASKGKGKSLLRAGSDCSMATLQHSRSSTAITPDDTREISECQSIKTILPSTIDCFQSKNFSNQQKAFPFQFKKRQEGRKQERKEAGRERRKE